MIIYNNFNLKERERERITLIYNLRVTSIPVAECTGPFTFTPRIAQSYHRKFLAVEQIEYSSASQVNLADSGDRVGVAFH